MRFYLAHVDLVGADLYVDRRVERAVELGRVRHDLRAVGGGKGGLGFRF